MNTHTRLMHSRIKLTKAQRNNLKIVLKSFFFQQITPHKEEHFRCKFVKTLSDSQRSGYTYYANWEAKDAIEAGSTTYAQAGKRSWEARHTVPPRRPA